MSKKEREQLFAFESINEGLISRLEASLKLGVSERWIREKYKRYREHGVEGIVHKGRGKVSKKRWSEKEKAFLMKLLENEWNGFTPTFIAEKLRDFDIFVSKETVRKYMIEAGHWQRKKRRKKRRKRRERRVMLGIMIQLDGSPHPWFEGRGEPCTLLVFIDDATSKILWLEFVESESSLAVMQATKNYIQKHGRPHEIYVDFGSAFSVNLNNADREKKSQWERAMQECGIRVIHAHSPQAKGRVERVNGTLQNRMVMEMRLANISSIEEANRWLRESDYIAKHNERFAVTAAKKGNAHRFAQLYDLDAIFCIKEVRTLANDYTISYQKRIFQLLTDRRTSIRPRDSVTVNTHLDGSITLSIRGIQAMYQEISACPARPAPTKEKVVERKPRKPSKNSQLWASGW